MTLVTAWVRNKGDLCELVVASDSRLSGGQRWDTCPKIVSLPRSDAVLAFAVHTDLAYPMMFQVIRAIASNPAFVERRYDITHQSSFISDVLNQMLDVRVL